MKAALNSILAAALILGTAGAASAPPAPSPDLAAGKNLYGQNCATCHGPHGEGPGVGVSLKGELKRKDLAHIVSWIKNPAYPHPKLYPSPLSARDVSNVAAYVATFK